MNSPRGELQGQRGNITALWAFSESGLGGFLHAFKTPLNGLVLAGMSVFCIGLLGSLYSGKVILRSLALVLGIKATVSPHSPPTAYLAVGFQGLLGTLLFSTLGHSRAVYVLFGAIALLESAVQRIVVLTLLLGEQFWVAVNSLMKDLAAFVNIETDRPAYYLVLGYAGLYTIWGIWVGYKAADAAENLLLVYEKYRYQHSDALEMGQQVKRKRLLPKWVMVLFLAATAALILVTSPSVQNGTYKAMMLLAQTLVVLALWYFVLVPVLRIALKKLGERMKLKSQTEWNWLMEEHVKLRQMIVPAWKLAGEEFKGLQRIKNWLSIYCAWALYDQKS